VFFSGLRNTYFDPNIERGALDFITGTVATFVFPLITYFCLFTFIVAAMVSMFQIQKHRIDHESKEHQAALSLLHVCFSLKAMHSSFWVTVIDDMYNQQSIGCSVFVLQRPLTSHLRNLVMSCARVKDGDVMFGARQRA
jgi:hypothetical protein